MLNEYIKDKDQEVANAIIRAAPNITSMLTSQFRARAKAEKYEQDHYPEVKVKKIQQVGTRVWFNVAWNGPPLG